MIVWSPITLFVYLLYFTHIEAIIRVKETGIRGLPMTYIAKSKIINTKTKVEHIIKHTGEGYVLMACLTKFPNWFDSVICIDDVLKECLILTQVILFQMSSGNQQNGDLRCLASQSKPYFFANGVIPTVVSSYVTWAGNGDYDGLFDGSFFYDSTWKDTILRGVASKDSWYCFDLGTQFTPPATIVVYGLNKPHDFYLTDSAPQNDVERSTLNGILPRPVLDYTPGGISFQSFHVDASFAGKRYFTIGHKNEGSNSFVGLINIEI